MDQAELPTPAIRDLLVELKVGKRRIRSLLKLIESFEDDCGQSSTIGTVTDSHALIFDGLSKDVKLTITALEKIAAKVRASQKISLDPPLQEKSEVPKWPLGLSEYRRYARQLVMPEVGIAGQVRLKKSSALIIGAGGLGCPAAAYLAGSGVGSIGVVDGDVVEESNLHRQIMHDTTKVGVLKVDSVIEAMRK